MRAASYATCAYSKAKPAGNTRSCSLERDGVVQSRQGGSGVETLSRILSRAAQRGCGAPAALLLPGDPAGPDLDAPDGGVAPLARASAIVHMLEAPGRSLRIHPNDKTSLFALLPREDRRWVAEADADVVVGVPGPGAEPLGVLAAGRRFDGRVVRSADVPFLEVLGAAAGLASGRLMRAAEAGAPDEPPAQECPACRYA